MLSKHIKKIEFPLYHGTSSIFLDSIMKKGLGGVDIGETYKTLEMFTQIVKVLQSYQSNQERSFSNSYTVKKMVSNDVTNGNLNFSYGGTYLTPCLQTASRYANSNKYGSELVSYFIKSYEELLKYDPKKAEQIFPLNHPLRQVISANAEPVIFEVDNVLTENLITEQGELIEEQLELMIKGPKELWQQLNFKSNCVISPSQLKVVEING